MKLAIINTATKGTEVHAAGCADVAKSAKRNKDEAWVIEADSQLEVSHIYWADQISDTCEVDSVEGWATAEAWLVEFNFLPCCGDLPHGSGFEGSLVEDLDDAPADEKVVSAWASAKLVDAAIAAGGTLAAKFTAAPASKTGSRSVRLTRSECDALREVATGVENVSTGQVARSARTLRDRLAAAWS